MFERLNKISVQVIISVTTVALSFLMLILLLFIEVPKGNRDLVNIMIGVVIGNSLGSVLGWLFMDKKSKTP